MPVLGDEEGMLPLGAGTAVGGADGPVVMRIDEPFGDAGVNHGLDSEGHPWG